MTSGRTIYDAWRIEPKDEAAALLEAIRGRELEQLQALGVNVADPAALRRARADHEITCRLRGRQTREFRDALRDLRRRGLIPPFDPRGIAEALREARERHLVERGAT